MNSILTYESNAWLAVAAYNNVAGDLTELQAQEFAKRYRVDYQYSENITGFGATLFWDTELQRHVIAIRGTEPTTFKDLLNDVFLGTGKAYEQEVALEAFYRRLTTSVADGGLGLLSTNTVVDVTGHSLGGFLTQVFTAKHPSIVNQAYTYNAPGLDGVWGNIKALFSASSSTYPNNKITNIAARDGLTFVADIGINFGSQDIEFPNSGHSSVTLANTISFYAVFATIDPNITINEITQFYDTVVQSGKDPVSSSLKALADIFQLSNLPKVEDMEVKLKKYATDNSYINLNINFLIDNSASSIATQAKGDKAILYALTKLNPFAIEGNLPAYTDIDPTHYSEKYLQDRAQYLYYLLDKTHRYDVDPTLSMTHFEDAALGSDYTLEQTFSRTRILFGGEGYSTLNGGEYGDHLYGMDGDDTMILQNRDLKIQKKAA